jgi:hypothetical protein
LRGAVGCVGGVRGVVAGGDVGGVRGIGGGAVGSRCGGGTGGARGGVTGGVGETDLFTQRNCPVIQLRSHEFVFGQDRLLRQSWLVQQKQTCPCTGGSDEIAMTAKI